MAIIENTEKGALLLEFMRGKELVNQADPIDMDALQFKNEVREMCKQNTCGRYERAWNCPPVCGTLEELEASCRSYSHAIMVNTVKQLEDSFDWEGMMEGAKNLADLLLEFDDYIHEIGIEEYRILGSGACNTCAECTYPDAPCRNPDKLFVPMEACGIDVVSLSADTGFKYGNGQGTVTYFGLILYN